MVLLLLRNHGVGVFTPPPPPPTLVGIPRQFVYVIDTIGTIDIVTIDHVTRLSTIVALTDVLTTTESSIDVINTKAVTEVTK